jgi:hypothetical protein
MIQAAVGMVSKGNNREADAHGFEIDNESLCSCWIITSLSPLSCQPIALSRITEQSVPTLQQQNQQIPSCDPSNASKLCDVAAEL